MRFQTSLILSMALVACSEDKGGGDPATDAAPQDAAPQDAAPQPMDAAPMDAAPEPMDAAPESMDAAPPAECEDLSGLYIWEGPCLDSTGATTDTPIAFTGCLSQTECVLGDDSVSARVMGDEASFDFPWKGGVCELRFADGDSNVACDLPDGNSPGERLMCTATHQRFTEPTAVSHCCDVVRQDCGPGLRCQAVEADAPVGYSACVPAVAEPIAEGGACSQVDGRLGADNCQAGTVCAHYDQPTPDQHVCTRYCQSETDCAAGEVCQGFSPTPLVGFCRSTCTLLGDDCPDGLTCRSAGVFDSRRGLYTVRPVCEWVGAAPVGEACTDGLDCGANLECIPSGNGSGSCLTSCDATHGCEPGTTCRPFTGIFGGVNPQGIGACYPDR